MAKQTRSAVTENEISTRPYRDCMESDTLTSALADLVAVAGAALRAEKKYRNSIAVADDVPVKVATEVENRKQKLERTLERRGIRLDA
jgi:hypothetical protein